MCTTCPLEESEIRMSLAPFSLKDAPSLIETVFPVGRISAEAYKERKAVQSQTLTGLGSYWKGRKPLILCRAVTLGCLLPATDNPAADLDAFLSLLAIDDAAFGRRFQGSASDFVRAVGEDAARAAVDFHDDLGQPLRRPRWRDDLDDEARAGVMARALAALPYSIESRLNVVKRPEELDEYAGARVDALAPFVWGAPVGIFGIYSALWTRASGIVRCPSPHCRLVVETVPLWNRRFSRIDSTDLL